MLAGAARVFTDEARPGCPVPATVGYSQAPQPRVGRREGKRGGNALPALKQEQEEGQEGLRPSDSPGEAPPRQDNSEREQGQPRAAGTD